MPAPTGGQWTAFMVDLQFDGELALKSSLLFWSCHQLFTCLPGPKSPTGWPTGEDGFFEFTSAISIGSWQSLLLAAPVSSPVPDTFPYEACNTPEECLGHIV